MTIKMSRKKIDFRKTHNFFLPQAVGNTFMKVSFPPCMSRGRRLPEKKLYKQRLGVELTR